MADYDTNLDGLFVDFEMAQSLVDDIEPRSEFKIKFIDEDNDGYIKYYSKNNDLIVISNCNDNKMAYISNCDCYGSGDSIIRVEFSKFVNMETKNGLGSDIKIFDKKLPFNMKYEFPMLIKRNPF